MIYVDIEKKLRFYDGAKELRICFSLCKNGFMGITGNSGIGKTTLLRMISGLTKPDRGKIEVNGETWFCSDRKINLHPSKRSVGYIPQEYTLFPNMTVRKNIEYAAENKSLVDELLDLVEMRGFEDSYPQGLSGGQKQRVSLARSLARNPSMILMDEPFSAVDCRMKGRLCRAINRMYSEFSVAIFLVSHNSEIINGMVNETLVIENGIGKNFGRMMASTLLADSVCKSQELSGSCGYSIR